MYKQVVFTLSGERPEYFEQTMESWCRAWRPDWSFNFYCEPGYYVPEYNKIVEEFQGATGAHGAIHYNRNRLGVLENPHHALSDAFTHKAEFAVLAEEDVLVSNDVLEYMQHVKALWGPSSLGMEDGYGAEAGKLLGACAFSRGGPTDDGEGYHLRQDFCPLVWGTWSEVWERKISPSWQGYAKGPAHGVEEGWDWGMQRLRAELEAFFVFPVSSRSQHIGEHGAHCTPELFKGTQAMSFREEYGPPEYGPRVNRYTWLGYV